MDEKETRNTHGTVFESPIPSRRLGRGENGVGRRKKKVDFTPIRRALRTDRLRTMSMCFLATFFLSMQSGRSVAIRGN